MRRTIISAMLTSLSLSPAFSQTQTPTGQTKTNGDCESNFKAADANGDGTLSKAEMSATPKVIPTQLSSQDSVSMQQFISACTAGSSKGGDSASEMLRASASVGARSHVPALLASG